MALYAIGDVQGCCDSLDALLATIAFAPGHDRLWFVGDLVNRGPKSAEVLRRVRGLGDSAVAVLGNHDLHLLACAALVRSVKNSDTLNDVLQSADADELIDWLRQRPLIHAEGSRILVHAGLHPSWSVDEAVAAAAEVEELLRAVDWRTGLAALYRGKVPKSWRADQAPGPRYRATVAFMTRLRTLNPDGLEMNKSFSGPLEEVGKQWAPWFTVAADRRVGTEVIFGHWAALGLHLVPGYRGLDTGCVWGNSLTAVRLDDGEVFQQAAID